MFTSKEVAKVIIGNLSEKFIGMSFEESHACILRNKEEYFKTSHSNGDDWVSVNHPDLDCEVRYYKGASALFGDNFTHARAFSSHGVLYINEDFFDAASDDTRCALIVHEYHHVKQYRTHLVKQDDATSKIMWRGVVFDDSTVEELDLPWERDAYFHMLLAYPNCLDSEKFSGRNAEILIELKKEIQLYKYCVMPYAHMMTTYEDSADKSESFHAWYIRMCGIMKYAFISDAPVELDDIHTELINDGFCVKYTLDDKMLEDEVIGYFCKETILVVPNDDGKPLAVVNIKLMLALSEEERLERLEIAFILGGFIKGKRIYNLGKPGIVWDGVLYPPETMEDYKVFSKLHTRADRIGYVKAHMPWQHEFIAKKVVCD